MAAHSENSTKRIWNVFIILSVLTIIEVVLGIYKPDSLYKTKFLYMNLLNWIFIILTIWKAYYIMWAFMHLEGEKASLRWTIVGTLAFLIAYLVFILLVEGDYVHNVFRDQQYLWIF
ncbi:cytochrome C oxidase subunit IV family protein [Flavobacterium agricola]|uniref:Cytochrome C oxidase subunit IV family protein n=1 Tax=Flavobacterium agricola TaxID=2870839 RepID=A0ABY6LWQ1_9FLAO|nr:cytochrome C oxidase subunit IV family protein [Flavobacterium agricola]UYW00757.1 cytochrome C oxidase subunit IV family protein [Flavobacterium agricola]